MKSHTEANKVADEIGYDNYLKLVKEINFEKEIGSL